MGELSKKIGKRIKELREANNIKQFELAEMLEMEPSNLTRIENGYQFPKEENLSKIASKLNVDEKELFNFSHIKTKKELINLINKTISNFDDKKLQAAYKLINTLKEI